MQAAEDPQNPESEAVEVHLPDKVGFTVEGQLHVEDLVSVPDWPKRYKALNFDDKKVKLLTKCREKMAEWLKMEKEGGGKDSKGKDIKWELQVDSKDQGVKVEYMTSIREKNTFKASGIVDFPAWVCFQVMTS
jgi:hypothetical protein